MNEPIVIPGSKRLRTRLGVVITTLGFFLFSFGANPGWFGMDYSPVVGYVQIAVFIFGLLAICLGGVAILDVQWNGDQKSVLAEIGVRLVGTGFLLAAVSGFADVFGLGTRPFPFTPFFGYWQARGVILGELVIIIGFLMMIPYSTLRPSLPKSS